MATRSEGSQSLLDSVIEPETDRSHKRLKLDGNAILRETAESSITEEDDIYDNAKKAPRSERSPSPIDSVIEPEVDRPHDRSKLDKDAAPQNTTKDSLPEADDSDDSGSEVSTPEETEERLNAKGGVEGLDWIRMEIDKRWFRMPLAIYQPERMNDATKAVIEKSRRTPPRFLYRVSSWEGRKKTNGFDIPSLHVPAAHMNENEKCHDTIYDIPNGLGELKEMLGRRFLWEDRRRDETLSWTSSLLFALVHATGRLAKSQRHVVIHVIDTTKVTTLHGKPVEFYFAPDLLDGLEIYSWPHWNGFEDKNITQPWYTHEWITHHVVKSPEKHSLEANIEDLLEQDLYTILPGLKTSEEDDLRSLYHRCVYTRGFYHHKDDEDRPPQPITLGNIGEAAKLALCFVDKRVRGEDQFCTPPLHIVIDFLSIVARLPKQEDFMTWVKDNYNQQDLQYIAYERMTRIANNLPEQAQALDLARDAHFAMDLPTIAETEVWIADEDFNEQFKWLKDLPRKIVIREWKGRKGLGLEKMLDDNTGEKGRVKRRASKKVQEAKRNGKNTKMKAAQESNGFLSDSDFDSNNDEDEAQMQMAVAVSLDPGLLEEADDEVGYPEAEDDVSSQKGEGETSRKSSVMDADLRETLERSQYEF